MARRQYKVDAKLLRVGWHVADVKFSPRLHERLVDAVQQMDVERLSIADVWRLAGSEAERLGLCRPGYHSILQIVLDERKRRADRREAITEAAGELWAYTGVDYEKLARSLDATRRR